MTGLIVVGGGPLIGTALVRRFARDGMPATILARGASTLHDLAEEVRRQQPDARVHGVVADATDEEGLRRGLDEAIATHGVPDVVIYNAARIRADRPGELSARELLDTLAVNVAGAITTGSHVLPRLRETGGSLLFTGGMPQVDPAYASLSLGKAGLRTVADLFRAEVAGDQVHVATVTVGGEVVRGTPYDPDLVAEVFAELHAEARGRWRSEVLVGPSPG